MRLGEAPLGVFDSGLGGLTVVRALRERCPGEDIVYLGDTARVPYGTRSPETIIRYALGCSRVLIARGVKAIVVACNTVSAVALDMMRVELDLPVLGVILPGARAAVEAAAGRPVGVLGTTGTITSGAYPRAIAALSTRTEVIVQAAPLLVPLAEEGWTEGEVPRLVARRYLEPLIASRRALPWCSAARTIRSSAAPSTAEARRARRGGRSPSSTARTPPPSRWPRSSPSGASVELGPQRSRPARHPGSAGDRPAQELRLRRRALPR